VTLRRRWVAWDDQRVRILAISGSLRAASLNSALLRAAARIAPADIEVEVSASIGALPLFNPDLESDYPAAVRLFKARLTAADAVLIASPEYAHGVTGTLKNALDWMVGNETFVNKPVALLNVSPRATHAQAALRETLITMSACLVEEACITVPILGSGLDEDGMVCNRDIAQALSGALGALRSAVGLQPA
jgi:chromate reductase, NAD(P)H dehydrogenase (quinone)